MDYPLGTVQEDKWVIQYSRARERNGLRGGTCILYDRRARVIRSWVLKQF